MVYGTMSKSSPETPGVIQAKLAHLRGRREALDELILCLERYVVYEAPGRPIPPGKIAGAARRLADAA
jgi:hypothetical protein